MFFLRFVQAYLLGKEWSAEVMSGAYKTLEKDLPLPPDVPGSRKQVKYMRNP